MNRRAFLLAGAGALAVFSFATPASTRAAQKEPLAVTYYFLPG
jgi:hypothetical protein